MSTHSFISRQQWSIGRFVFSVLGGLFVAIQFVLLSSPITLAFSVPNVAAPPEDVTRAGVSVVRLLVSYTDAKSAALVAQCTGLGIIVASQATSDKAPTIGS